MDVHEYQAKEILARFGVRVPRGGLAYSTEQAAYRAREIGGARWAVKAQVHAGGRGEAGGVILCDDEQAVFEAAARSSRRWGWPTSRPAKSPSRSACRRR